MRNIYRKINKYYDLGKRYFDNHYHISAKKNTEEEIRKAPTRTEVINYLLNISKKGNTNYLEIGVRNPNHNFNHIKAKNKYSVDPGVEFKENPVDFKITSDDFFKQLRDGKILSGDIRFDVIFIDGLHLAEQVNRDVVNALDFISDDGFIVLHDCNPPTEWHAREECWYQMSPAGVYWNGTVWKAFYRLLFNQNVSCCCIDSDWGIGIVSKRKLFQPLTMDINPFLEFSTFNNRRKESLNLVTFNEFNEILEREHDRQDKKKDL
jgi:hypothetical protein